MRRMYEVASARVSATAFEYVHHLLTVPVSVNGIEARFVLDSGIGVTLLSSALCEQAGVDRDGTSYTGRRMSGQAVTLELGRARALGFASIERSDEVVGVLDLDLPPELADVGGFLSLAFFDGTAFTVDYPRGQVVLEDDESLAARAGRGCSVDVFVERDGPAVTVFSPLTIPGGRSISVEVDMGSDVLILDERFANEVGVDLNAEGLRRLEGVDETGNPYTRTFAKIAGTIELAGVPQLAQAEPDVQFQRIIHDGLVGQAFLRRFAVTWDLSGGRMIFALPG